MSNTDKLTDFAISKLNTVFDGVQHALPTVTKYALQVTSLNCLSTILIGLFFFVIFSALAITDIFVYRWLKVKVPYWSKQNYRDDYREESTYFVVLLGFLTIISLIVSVSYLMDFWSWIGIWHPDLYLVHLAVQKALGG